MIVVLKTLLILLSAGLSFLLRTIFSDWRSTKSSEVFISTTTPFERMKYNAIFFSIASCISIIIIVSLFIIFSSVQVKFPFWA